MKKILILLIMLLPLAAAAQEIIVKSFSEAPATSLGKTIGDIPKTNEGEDAAVIVVKADRSDLTFEGRILKDEYHNEPAYQNGEYTIYMAPRSKSLTVKIPGFPDERVIVADYPNTLPAGLQSRRMYVLYLDVFSKGVVSGRNLSWGVSGGYLLPHLVNSSDNFIGSPINYGVGGSGENADYTSLSGFVFGINADIRMHKNLYVNIGLNYNQYSYKNSLANHVEGRYAVKSTASRPAYFRTSESYKFGIIEVPIYVSYHFPVTRRSNIQIGVGPVLTYGLNAKMKFQTELLYKGIDGILTTGEVMNYIEYTGDIDLYSTSAEYSRVGWTVEGTQSAENVNNNFTQAPYKRLNVAAGAYLAYEIYGVSLSVHYRYMIGSSANQGYWEGNRINIFDIPDSTPMSGYKQRTNMLQIKIGYTLRY